MRRRVWMGALTFLILGLTGGCPDKKPTAGAEAAPKGPPAEAKTEAAPVAPTFVATPFPAKDLSLLGQWKPMEPLDALQTLTLNEKGVAQLGRKLSGEASLTSSTGRWEVAGAGVRVTLTAGKITEINELEYGTVEGAPRLRWSGKTHTFEGAEGKPGEKVHSEKPVLLQLPGWKKPS